MKKRSLKYILITLAAMLVIVPIHLAMADSGGGTFIDAIKALVSVAFPETFIVNALSAWLGYILITVMQLWTSFTASLLNASISLTLNIKDFVSSTNGVYVLWQTLRDLSGMFMIFALLYAAFKMILGDDAKIQGTIKNIVIAGILINFSFLITSVLIDASNMVSLALYHQMVPVTAAVQCPPPLPPPHDKDFSIDCLAKQSLATGSISDIFMNSLRPQGLLNVKALIGANGLQIALFEIVGSIIMFIVGLSFLLAALAFMYRFVILIFLLGFSPLVAAAMVVPGLSEASKKFTDALKSQLIFMPVYLLLMYASFKVLLGISPASMAMSAVTSGKSLFDIKAMTGVVINYVLVGFLLNLPLVVAVKLGGMATEWINMKKVGAAAMWKKVGSQVGSRTVGRAAYSFGQSEAFKNIASRVPIAGTVMSNAVSKVGNAGFGEKKGGYEDRLKAKGKAMEDLHKKIGTVNRSNYKTEAEYQEAKTRATEMQSTYRQNLPWKSGVIGFMVDNRANRDSSSKLEKEAIDEKKKEDVKQAKKDMGVLRAEEIKLNKSPESNDDKVAKLKKRENELKQELVLTDSERAELKKIQDDLLDIENQTKLTEKQKKDRLTEIETEKNRLQGVVDEGEDLIAKDRDAQLLKRIDENMKSSGGGSSTPPPEPPKTS